MEQQSTPVPATYNILNIVLLESSFKREALIDFETTKPEIKVNHNAGVNGETGELVVELSATLTVTQNDGQPAYNAEVKMIGIFRKNGESDLEEANFLHQNAPAIIFPFVREHISSLCRKAGLTDLFLPPLNFTKRQ